MAFSQNIADLRQLQQDKLRRCSPSERLLMALELSDLCVQLQSAGKQALKEADAAGTAQKNY